MAFNSALWEEKSKKRAARVQQTLKREAVTQKIHNEAVRAGMSQGMSWEDISKKAKIPLARVQDISQQTNPNYGIKAPPPSLFQQVKGVNDNLGTAIKSVGKDVLGISARDERTAQLQNQVLDARKRQIMNSGVFSPETKKQLLGQIKTQQRAGFATRNAQLASEQVALQRAQDLVKNPATVGAGVKRSGEGLLQGIGGIADVITPGKGQNRLTQFATRNAEGTDQFVKDNGMNGVLYKGGQLTGEALQMLTGAKAIKALSAVPGTAKILAVAGKADDLENALMSVNKGGKVGEAAIKTARYLLDPAKVANIAANTTVDQGQISARGQQITPGTVGTSVAANYALGGVLDAAGAGLARRATNKANVAQDAATAVDNARINNAVDSGVEGLLPNKSTSAASDTVTTYSGGKKATGWSTENQDFVKTHIADTPDAKIHKKTINKSEVLDIRNPEHRASLEAKLGKEKVASLVDGSSSGLPHMNKVNNPAIAEKELIKAADDLGYKHVALSETDDLGKFNGEDVVSYADTPSALNINSPKLTSQVDAPTTRTTGSALATERRAIEDSVVKELEGKAQYDVGSYSKETDNAIALVQNDRAKAEAIALGREPGNNVIHEVTVRKALEAEARKNKDANMLQRIAQSQSNVKTSEAAQRLGAEGYNKDPESPVEVMKDVLNARKDTKLKGIPKDLTADEAAKITNLADEITTKKAAIPEGSPEGSPERLEYGVALTNLRRYKNELIDGTKTRREKVMPKGVLNATFGTAKSLKASLDNSFFGRQGLKVLTTHPTIWGKAFIKSWGDIGKGLKGIDALDALDANTLSRSNNINGRYGKMKLDIHGAEEAFPSSLPEKVPGLGRLFKASEYAYVGAAHRMRADLADQILEKAQKAGVDIDDPKQLESIGKLINAMTGRGHLGKAEPAADTLNNLFFSPRNWKSNIDTITAHQLQKGVTPFVRKEAAKNLLKMVAVVGATLAAAENFKPGSVEKDPRSSDFGKIKIGNTRFDVSGGMASIATVASRLATRETKSTTTGQVTKLNGDEFGARSTWDVLMDYAEGKMSPGAGAIKQILTGKNFIGEKVTPGSMVKDLFVPLPVANYEELKNDPKSANTLVAMISDALGVGTNTYSAQKDWNQSNTKKITGFKQTVDAKKFSEANNAFNEAYSQWLEKATNNDKFKKLPEQTQKTLLSQKSQDLTDEILKKYGYEYKTEKKSPSDKQLIKDLKGL